MGVQDEQTVYEDKNKTRTTLHEDKLIVSSIYVHKFP